LIDVAPAEVIEFWLGAAPGDREAVRAKANDWYRSTPELDRDIKKRFGATIERAIAGELVEWESSPEGALAIVLVLDQFSRNAYRGTAEAFAGDRVAIEVAKRAIEAGFDKQVAPSGRVFFYHPFEHSESVTEQNRSIVLFETFVEDMQGPWREFAEGFLGYARGHREVVARFGRFPHRNKALKRANSAAETDYLETASGYGQ